MWASFFSSSTTLVISSSSTCHGGPGELGLPSHPAERRELVVRPGSAEYENAVGPRCAPWCVFPDAADLAAKGQSVVHDAVQTPSLGLCDVAPDITREVDAVGSFAPHVADY